MKFPTKIIRKADFGLHDLLPEWRSLLSTKNLMPDFIAGTIVAFVAIPLSLAIALASGVEPGAGLITAIIAGIVCALFGGTPLAVSGPAAAMSILIANTIQNFGLEGLLFIGLLAGFMQLICGFFGLGLLSRFVPLPVISGFTAGIGVIILIGQLPRAFGLMPPEESHTFDVIRHLQLYFHDINYTCFLMVILTIVIIRGLPKVLPKIPPILPAVAITTAIVYFFHLDIPLIGAIPKNLSPPQLPKLPDISTVDLVFNAFTIFLLASLETLLSSSAIDKLSNSKKHDANQELIGQGLGNIAAACFGGIPVTGVIARSATNVQAGAKTRRASIIHSLFILLSVYFFANLISYIPIAALAGVLFSVAYSMINYREFYKLWQTSRPEAIIYAVTFGTIICVDLVAGVQAGIVAASLFILFKVTKTNLHVSYASDDEILRISLTGPLTFLSVNEMQALEKKLESIERDHAVIVDLSGVNNVDTSGCLAVVDLFKYCQDHNINFYIMGLSTRFESLFQLCGGKELLNKYYLVSETELKNQLDTQSERRTAHGRLIHGVHRFYMERNQSDRRLFRYIVSKQDPHTLFIACADSRVVPSLITSTDPGELFTIRNIGNYVPPYLSEGVHSEAAALEFALLRLNITDIVICGHANCGAMQACKMPARLFPTKLSNWVDMIRTQLNYKDEHHIDELARINVLQQVENLKAYPIVQDKLAKQEIFIHAWFFDFDNNLLYEWNDDRNKFVAVLNDSQAIEGGVALELETFSV